MSEAERLEMRLRALGAAADGADWDDVLQRAGGRLWVRSPRRRLAPVLAAVALAVFLAGISASLWAGHTPVLGPRGDPGPTGAIGATGASGPTGSIGITGVLGPTGTGGVHRPPPPPGSNPYGQHGRQITIDELRAEAPWLPLPSSDLANDGNVGTVWVKDHTADASVPEGHLYAAVYYPTSGIELLWYENSSIEEDGTIGHINGVPANLYDPTSAGNTSPFEQGMLYLHLQVLPDRLEVLKGRVPKSDLLTVAKTLSFGAVSPAGALPPANLEPRPSLSTWNDGVLAHAVSVDSVEAAADSLPVPPVAPSTLGEPDQITMTAAASAAPHDRILSFRYDGAMGAFWLLERPTLSTTASLLREIGSVCAGKAAEDCNGEASTVDLGDGVGAVSVLPWSGSGPWVAWVQNGVYFEVVGYTEDAYWRETISIAKAVAAAAAG